MLDNQLYYKEMTAMVNKAIDRLQLEMPNFKIYTASIWTDPNAAVSSINFDSKTYSIKQVKQRNAWFKKYRSYHLVEGDLKMAALFKPNKGTRIFNPANFLLRDFELIRHKSFPRHWESNTNSRCWKKLEPALIEIGDYTFMLLKTLHLEKGFELSINSARDWYDKTWA
jgi:hypothetical protein